MNIKQQITEDYYIIFCKSKYKAWFMRWFNPDISHVYAMKKSPGGQFWQVIDSYMNYLDISLILIDDYPHPRVYAGDDAVILPVRVKIGNKPIWSLGIFSCVDVMKGLLGIRSFLTWTPYQLYKRLRGLEK